MYYGYTKVRDILTREFVLQITEMPRSSFGDVMSFPDIMMCSTGTRLRNSSRLLDVNNNQINITMINLTAVPQQMYHDLCNKHAWLTIFSTKNQLVNVTQNEDSIYNIMLDALPDVNEVNYFGRLRFLLRAMGNVTEDSSPVNLMKLRWYCAVLSYIFGNFTLGSMLHLTVSACIPSNLVSTKTRCNTCCLHPPSPLKKMITLLDDNPFLTGKNVPHEVWSDMWDNNFGISQNYTTLQIQVTNVQTFVLRKDFWGLFGETEDVPKRSVSSVGSSFFRSGGSQVDIYLPKKEIHLKQIP